MNGCYAHAAKFLGDSSAGETALFQGGYVLNWESPVTVVFGGRDREIRSVLLCQLDHALAGLGRRL